MGARTLLRGLVALAMLPLLVDRIGATPAGLFIFATTLTGYFTAVEWGLATSVTKYVAAHRATGDARQLGSLLRASLALLLGLGVLIAVLLVLLALLLGRSLFDAPSVRSQAAPTLLVAAGTALLYWPSRIGTAALQGLERYDLCALLETASALLAFASIYVVSGLTHSVAVLTALFGAAAILMGVGAGALAWPRLGLRRGLGSWRGAHLRSLLGFGGGLFLIGLSDTFIYESDRIVVTAFVGVAAIVVYEVALRIYTSVRLISGLIGAALVSTSSRLAAENRAERLRELVLVGSLYTVMLTVPLAVLILVLARPLVDAWVGHGYGRHAVYVQIFVSCWLVGANGGVLASAMTGIGRIRAFVVLTVLGALITLGLSIGLTAAWGTVGVIWGTVISSWVGFPIWMHYALRQVEISKARYAREVLAPGYLPVMAWTVPVVACARLLHPTGLPGLGAFCAIALAVLVLALAPMLRARWRRMLVEPPLRGANAVPAGIGASP
jgi:O-antigen/teichoic acid export membrane protein